MPNIGIFVTLNKLTEYFQSSKETSDLWNKNFDKINSIFEECDEEYVDGTKHSNEEPPDFILSNNEQKTFLDRLKTELPEVFTACSSFFEKLTTNNQKTDNIANNIHTITSSCDILPNKQMVDYALRNLNKENLFSIANTFLDKGGRALFLQIFASAEDSINGYDTQKIIKEFKEYGDHLITLAKEKNIYIKDYEQRLSDAYKDEDYTMYSMCMDRIIDRISIETDPTLNASKRKLDLKEPNGKIDNNFNQGNTGDCWVLSAINAICQNEKYLEKLNNMINVEKDGDKVLSVTVNIQGKDYKIDYEELFNANEYSTGDLDVRALEIAINRYTLENKRRDISLGGFPEDAYKIIFGEENTIINNFTNENYNFDSQSCLKNLTENGSNIFSNINVEEAGKQAINQKGETIDLDFPHAYSFVKTDSEFLYFKDPRFSNEILKIRLTDFSDIFNSSCTCEIKD